MLRGAEGPRDAVVQRPRVATACRGTAQHYSVQRDRATLRGTEGPRDTTFYLSGTGLPG